MRREVPRGDWPVTVAVLAEELENDFKLEITMLRYAEGATYTQSTAHGVPSPKFDQWGCDCFGDLRREADLYGMFPEFKRRAKK